MTAEIFELAEKNDHGAVSAWLMTNKDNINITVSEHQTWYKKLFGAVWIVGSAIFVALVPKRAKVFVGVGMAVLGMGIIAAKEYNEDNIEDWTLLHFAARGDALNVAQLLIENGADYSKKAQGKTFLDIAVKYSHVNFKDGCNYAIKLKNATRKTDSDVQQVSDSHRKTLEGVIMRNEERLALIHYSSELHKILQLKVNAIAVALPLVIQMAESMQAYATAYPQFTQLHVLVQQLNESIKKAEISEQELQQIHSAAEDVERFVNENAQEQPAIEAPETPETPLIEGTTPETTDGDHSPVIPRANL